MAPIVWVFVMSAGCGMRACGVCAGCDARAGRVCVCVCACACERREREAGYAYADAATAWVAWDEGE